MVLTRSDALNQPILDPEVELELIRAWKEDGNEKALDAISRSYARLCYSIASQYTNNEHRMEDLAQEGSFGIRRAIEKFDPSRGTKFSTYSRDWVRNFIAAAVSRVLNDITVPARAYNDARMGRLKPGVNDSAIQAVSQFIMLDSTVSGENMSPLMDAYVREDRTPESILAEDHRHAAVDVVIGKAMQYLDKREAIIIQRRKLQDPPDTLEQISLDFNVTRERIRQIEAQALKKMKKALEATSFDSKAFFES